MQIAIDGPGGAGKSTLSKKLAKTLRFVYIDTGAMYRAAGLLCLRNGIEIRQEPDKAIALTKKANIDLVIAETGQKILLNGEDVTDLIRTPEISMAASDVSAIPEVRLQLVELQRKLGQTHDVIMDGRDIGTYVLPNASIKIFLTAAPEVRAKRRLAELTEKGEVCDYDTVLADLKRRDHNDSTRAFAPLKAAEDSIVVDTSELTFEESFTHLYTIIKERL
ncbi:MAG: (d)CMP kinase [Ruminococcaceae bacterium]|nr:(d)CMP kinase [Oscillospiraceae bacterium]